MILVRILIAAAAVAAASSAHAQAIPPYVAPGADPQAWQGDQHRYEIDRLRTQADQRETFARQVQLETRQSQQEIEAARQTDIAREPAARALRSPEEERALRESATRRRQTTSAGVGQIDDWLDRPTR